MEKVMDRIARELDMDPAEVRRRNFIQKDEYPYGVGIIYRDNNPLEYDSGDYPACLKKALAAVVSIAMQYMLAWPPAAYLPIPFAVTVWVGLGALRRSPSAGLLLANDDPRARPEDSWLRQRIAARRWGIGEPLLVVPIAGPALVTQGFSGALSHAGAWRHALDLQRPLALGAAAELRESLWDTPVFAPAPGIVERTCIDVAGKPPGAVNFAESWGNHVVLRLDQGGYAMLLSA